MECQRWVSVDDVRFLEIQRDQQPPVIDAPIWSDISAIHLTSARRWPSIVPGRLYAHNRKPYLRNNAFDAPRKARTPLTPGSGRSSIR